MSDFVNTIDLLGDDVVVKQIIDGVITEFKDDVVTNVRSEGFIDCMNLTVVDLPNLTTSYLRSFGRCTNLRTVNLPKLSNIGMYLFDANKAIEKLVFPSVTSSAEGGLRAVYGLRIVDFHVKIGIPNRMFDDDLKLTCLILRSETQCDLLNAAAFTNTPIASGTGYIYVPRALLDTYKTATNWTTYANQFRALEDFTVDGTTTGELDESKI